MRTETPVAVKLSDYSPYPFKIDHVDLNFDLNPSMTKVVAEMKVTRIGEGPMVLDGEELALTHLEIDGEPLAPTEYTLTDEALTLLSPPSGRFVLKTEVEIKPEKNTALSGLYMSGGRFCTQCEATGFRRITFYPDRPDVMSRFHVWMAADKLTYPVLLSNGTPMDAGNMDNDRHFAEWDDPHPKPAYLFALCAGSYDVYTDSFTTQSGKEIDLAIYVDKGSAPKAAWAMDSLKRSMKWDEDVYGLEYDLGVFNIVAVRDFNFGAMENKGLNIFNSAYVLADEATATDFDFEAIESIVAHEYFHNWTGNRVTCRDWFQLCLKEGLTVFRDQNFSADMRSRPVQRIKDVIRLRARQFSEDAGPLAHPVRPDTYAAIDNLYSATVYEKGAEVIGMLSRLIGAEDYRKGIDLYFERHDGQAVTIEDFYACFETVTGRDLSAFMLWYSQAGTPIVTLKEAWDANSGRLEITLTQSVPDTPGQKDKRPMVIPLDMALLGDERTETWQQVLDTAEITFGFDLGEGAARPIVSINSGFSAPVRIVRELSRDSRIRMINLESDPFNTWDAIQQLTKEEIISLSKGEIEAPDQVLLDAIYQAVTAYLADPAYAALLMRLPDIGEMMLETQPSDPSALGKARKTMQAGLYRVLADLVDEILAVDSPAPFNPGVEQAGIRSLRTAMIVLLGASGTEAAADRLLTLYKAAPNMTEKLGCLRALAGQPGPARDEAMQAFEAEWSSNPLVMDKWFAAQASTGTVEVVETLMKHSAFDFSNPNRVRAVTGVFSMQNLAEFHRSDGAGYRLLEDVILKTDAGNPALASRLLTPFEQWKILEPKARAAAEDSLERLKTADLSKNTGDILMRALS